MERTLIPPPLNLLVLPLIVELFTVSEVWLSIPSPRLLLNVLLSMVRAPVLLPKDNPSPSLPSAVTSLNDKASVTKAIWMPKLSFEDVDMSVIVTSGARRTLSPPPLLLLAVAPLILTKSEIVFRSMPLSLLENVDAPSIVTDAASNTRRPSLPLLPTVDAGKTDRAIAVIQFDPYFHMACHLNRLPRVGCVFERDVTGYGLRKNTVVLTHTIAGWPIGVANGGTLNEKISANGNGVWGIVHV